MLHEKITSKGVLRTVANMLADDLREDLGHLSGYDVEVEHRQSCSIVKVYSDQACAALTGTAVDKVMDAIRCYEMRYEVVLWNVTTVEKGDRVIPAIDIQIMKSLV